MENTTRIYDNITFNLYGSNSTGRPTNETSVNDDMSPESGPYGTVYQVLKWGLIALVVSAVVGNVLIIIVMTNKRNRNSRTSAFFTVLGVSDLLVIIFGPFDRLMMQLTDYDNNVGKPFIIFKTIVLYTTVHVSSWMIVCITMERVISVTVPHRVKTICVRKLKVITIVSICFTALVLNTSFYAFFLSLNILDGGYEDWEETMPNAWDTILLVDAAMSYFIPVCLLIAGSSCIIIMITVSSNRIGRNKSLGGENKKNATKNRNNSVSRILLASVLVFLLTMSPYYVFSFWISDNLSVGADLKYMLNDVFLFFIDMNSALNFYVYFLTGSQFRNDVKGILPC